MDTILKNSVENLFLGLVAGDGDVFSRMASSYPDSQPAYPEPLAGLVNTIKVDFDRGKFSALRSDAEFREAIKPYFESFERLYSPEDFPTDEDDEDDEDGNNSQSLARSAARFLGLTWIERRSFYRAKNCKTGIACGDSCISKNKTCKKTLPPAVQAQKPPAAKKTKKATTGTATPPATPATSAPVSQQTTPPTPATPTAAPALTTSGQASSYKPLMTRAEADKYTKNSVWKNKVFYHGTDKRGADNITTKGVDPDKTSTSWYGKGFYTTTAKKTADEYAKFAGTNPTRIACKLDVRKPFIVRNHYDMCNKMAQLGVQMSRSSNQSPATARQVREVLIKNGYDAIEVTESQYFIPLNQSQVAVYEAKALK